MEMKLKERLNRIYDFINERNKHPLRNGWVFSQISLLPSIYSYSISKPSYGMLYGLCQCGIILFLHLLDEWLAKPINFQTTLDNYLGDV
ncbi:MAG: hypothetical protein QXP77_01035 [Candidatus Aenigmatarchaeota archaeon]